MATYWPRRLAANASFPWQYLLVAVVALVVFASGDRSIYLLGAAFGMAALAVIFYDRRLAIPIVIISLPLEISKEIFPFLPTSKDWATYGNRISIIDIGRLAILLVSFVWAMTARRDWTRYLPRTNLILPLGMLFGLYLISLSYTIDIRAGLREIIRLMFNLSFFLLIPLLVRDRANLRLCLWTLIGTGLALGLLGIYQEFLGTYFFLWNPKLLLETSTRVNATFANPNFFARFLNISILMCIASLFIYRERHLRSLLIVTIAIDLFTLLLTSSRNGWVTLFFIMPLVLLMFPIKKEYKFALLTMGGVGVLSIILAASFFSDTLATRFETFQLGLRAIGERYYLIQGGWQMFIEHPLTGVGLGGYLKALQGPYFYIVWWKDGYLALPSHTAFVTLLAELGWMSLVVVTFIMYRVGRLAYTLYQHGRYADKLMIIGLVGMLMIITLSSQVEGRLFEDPYLWLGMGLLVALEGIIRRDIEDGTLTPEATTIETTARTEGVAASS